jgi:peroxiredoxin
MARTLSSQVLKTGEKAPSFQLKGVDGKMYSLDNFNSKSVLVVFIVIIVPMPRQELMT